MKRSHSTANYCSSKDIFQRLYLEKDKKRVQKMENEVRRQAKELQECTFHPKTNNSRGDVSPSLGRRSAGSNNVFERLAQSNSQQNLFFTALDPRLFQQNERSTGQSSHYNSRQINNIALGQGFYS